MPVVQRVDHLAEDRVEFIVAERRVNSLAEGFLLMFPVHTSHEEGVVVVKDPGELLEDRKGVRRCARRNTQQWMTRQVRMIDDESVDISLTQSQGDAISRASMLVEAHPCQRPRDYPTEGPRQENSDGWMKLGRGAESHEW